MPWLLVVDRCIMTDIKQLHSWQVRPLAPDDVDVVADVLGLARLHQADGCYLVAWAGSTPLGHVHLAFNEPPELQDLEVRPSHRRLGVGTALVAAAEDEARARGFRVVRLDVSVDDVAARALYRKSGYLDTGLPIRRVKGRIVLRTGPIDVDENLLVLTKSLVPTRPRSTR
jgi:GNAT superfamily N-acetyltransferase